jgi:glycosyltransferase involved in cell wall biosynthesis
MSEATRLSILVPVYNERGLLRAAIERIVKAPLPDGFEREVILVDDASTDGTTELVRELQQEYHGVLRAFYQPENRGKGAAIRRAIEEMTGQYALFQDADLEYDPNEYSVLLQPFIEQDADVVYGSRFASRRMRRVLNFHHALGNRLLTLLSNLATGLNLTDMETCYKVFRSDLLKTIPLRSDRFGIEPEITAKIAKRQCIVYEVPISYHGRGYGEGKKIGWRDGFQALAVIAKYWILDDCYNERYGEGILRDLAHARRFNAWMAKRFEPYLGERILEIGSGIGNISRHLPRREKLTLSDMDPMYLDLLEQAYRDHQLVDVKRFDLTSDGGLEELRAGRYDTVVCLNVLEHIGDDADALKRLRSLLEPGGRLALLVPQYPGLYGVYDRRLGHVRRYRKDGLERLLKDCGFDIVTLRGFNSLSILGWWLNSKVLQRETMGAWQIKLFDMTVPVLRVVESVIPLPGLSLLAVAQKPDAPAAG